MDDRCAGVLRELVEKYGPAVLGETRRVKGALLDAKIERARVWPARAFEPSCLLV